MKTNTNYFTYTHQDQLMHIKQYKEPALSIHWYLRSTGRGKINNTL